MSLTILQEYLDELSLNSLVDYLETYLHEEASLDRPLTESLVSFFNYKITQRRQRTAKMRLTMSGLPVTKTLEEFELDNVEGISSKQLQTLGSLSFIDRKENIVLMGQSGLGKSHILYALCYKACLAGHSVYQTTCQELMEKLLKAKQQNRLSTKIKSLCNLKILAIDEIGYQNLTAEEASLFFQLISKRYEKGTLILTTNKAFGQWGELLGDTAIATATLDRLLHYASVFILKGESYRLKKRKALGIIPSFQ